MTKLTRLIVVLKSHPQGGSYFSTREKSRPQGGSYFNENHALKWGIKIETEKGGDTLISTLTGRVSYFAVVNIENFENHRNSSESWENPWFLSNVTLSDGLDRSPDVWAFELFWELVFHVRNWSVRFSLHTWFLPKNLLISCTVIDVSASMDSSAYPSTLIIVQTWLAVCLIQRYPSAQGNPALCSLAYRISLRYIK